MTDTYSFGEWLKQRRKQLKLTQREVATAATTLFTLRTQLIRHIDPLNAQGSELHDFIMQRVRKIIGEK